MQNVFVIKKYDGTVSFSIINGILYSKLRVYGVIDLIIVNF
jgi:hypothetical protein